MQMLENHLTHIRAHVHAATAYFSICLLLSFRIKCNLSEYLHCLNGKNPKHFYWNLHIYRTHAMSTTVSTICECVWGISSSLSDPTRFMQKSPSCETMANRLFRWNETIWPYVSISRVCVCVCSRKDRFRSIAKYTLSAIVHIVLICTSLLTWNNRTCHVVDRSELNDKMVI